MMKKISNSFKLFFLTIPQVLVVLTNLVLVLLQVLDVRRFSLAQSVEDIFWLAFFSCFFLTLYVLVSNSERKIEYAPHIFIMIFYIVSFYILYLFLLGVGVNNLVYLVFIQLEVFRIVRRLIFGGFPLGTFVVSYLVVYFIFQEKSAVWIQSGYFAFQVLEDLFNIGYRGLGNFLFKKFPITLLFMLWFSFLLLFTRNDLGGVGLILKGIIVLVIFLIDFFRLDKDLLIKKLLGKNVKIGE